MSHDIKKSPMLDALYESVRQKREEEERSQVTLLRAEIEELRAQNAELLEALEEEKQWYPKYLSADGRAIQAENLMKELLGALMWLDRRGGLGHDAHDRIRATIAKAKGGAA